jgi:serine/threonine protein kinase
VALKKQKILNEDGIAGWVLREVDVMKRIRHSNILSINDVFMSADVAKVWMVLPWYNFSLKTWIISTPFEDRVKNLLSVTGQLLDAVSALHSNSVVHYDIKSDNILIDATGNISLCDFGLCNPGTIDDTHAVCSINYRPPELLTQEKSKAIYKPSAVDVWSLGKFKC